MIRLNLFFLVCLLVIAPVLCPHKAETQSPFLGFLRPIDWASYDGTATIGGGYSTTYRGNYLRGPEGSGSHPGADITHNSNGNHLTSSSEIRCIYDGVVIRKTLEAINFGNGWGNCLVIRHTGIPDAGPSGVIFSTYAHLTLFANNPVKCREWEIGDSVPRGALLGFAGNTGRATGTHLHFQIDKDYSEPLYPFHPFWPNRTDGIWDASSEVDVPDSDNLVAEHTINPIPFVEAHLDLTPTLKAFYPLNGNANDQSGIANNGATFGDVHYVAGRICQAASFDGATGYISVPGSTSLDLNHFTLAAWINPTAIGNRGRIIEKGASNSYYMYLNESGNPLVGFYDGTFHDLVSPESLQPNTWYFVVGTYNKVSLKLYVDGGLVNSVAASSAPSPTSEPLIIGWKFNGIDLDHFAGLIDELRIYNIALSASEIQDLYNQAP